MTMEDNLRFNKTIEKTGYKKYDNYEAIEVPKVVAIPSVIFQEFGSSNKFFFKYNFLISLRYLVQLKESVMI